VGGRVKPALAEALLVRGRGRNEQALGSGVAKLFDEAIEDLTESITLAPGDEGYSARGFAYNARREYDKAVTDFSRALALNPRNILALHNRGFAYNALKDYAKGIEDFSAAIRLKPNDHPTAYNNRGYAQLQLGEFDKAIDDYTEAIRQSRVEPEQSKIGLAFAFRGRGDRFEKIGDFDKAESDYTKALEHAEKVPSLAEELKARIAAIASNQATALALQGRLGEALSVAGEYVARHPKQADAYATRAYVYFKRRQFRESLADYTQAIELAPKDPKHYMRRGMVHTVDRNTNAAIKDLSAAIELDKSLVEAYQLRAKAYAQRGLQADAALAEADEKTAAELMRKAPDAPPAPDASVK
jgi:tetratricopeptide (TPR) repeat protein